MATAKPRILFLITTSDWGGAQRFVFNLASAARTDGHPVLVAAGGTGELGDRCLAAGIDFRPLRSMRREISPVNDLSAIYEIRMLCRAFRPDIVHLNSSKMGVVGAIAAQAEHVPRTIYRIGGWAFLEDVSPLKKALYLYAEKWTAADKDIIVTLHPDDEKIARAKNITPRSALVTIPNGIDLEHFDQGLRSQQEARASLHLPSDAFVVGTIANAYPPKNLPWFVRAMTPWLEAHPSAHLAMIGEGPGQAALEAAVAASPTRSRIHLAGRRADASSLLPAFDTFILPSTKEGMPWALLEAMAAGLPCIATNVGACAWMLADAGVIIPPKDADAMRAALDSLVGSDEQRDTLGQKARKEVERRFRWEETLRRSLHLFT